MSAVIHKLQLHYSQFPQAIDEDGRTWVFDQKLEKQSRDFFLPLLHQLGNIRIEYDVLQNQLAGLINSSNDLKKHEQELVSALMLAETLQYQYCHFFGIKREVSYFKQQVQSLRIMLRHLGYVFPENPFAEPEQLSDWHVSQTIRNQTNQYNLLRQIVQRSKKFIVKLDQFVNSLSTHSKISEIDHSISPIINYLAFILFLPRTASNSWILAKHLIPGGWMTETEMSLGWNNRLALQLKRRGFELGDDLVWCVVNFSICFIFIGPLSHWAMPMLMAQQISEAFSRVAKTIVYAKPLLELRNHYLGQLKQPDLDAASKDKIQSYLAELDKRIEHEIKLLTLSALNSTTILVLALLTISLFNVSPIIPVTASALLVVVTGLNYFLTKALNKEHPNEPEALTSKTSELGLFSSPTDIQDLDNSKTQPGCFC